MNAQRHPRPEVEAALRERFRKYIIEGLSCLMQKDSAIIQYLLYEGWLREYVRDRLKTTGLQVSKGIVIEDEAFEAGKSSPECDIIVYQPPAICVAETGTIAIVPAKNVRGIVEVERELKPSEDLVSKIQRFRAITENVFIMSYRLWQYKLGETYETRRQQVEKALGARIYCLSYGYGDGKGTEVQGEIDRLLEDLTESAVI